MKRKSTKPRKTQNLHWNEGEAMKIKGKSILNFNDLREKFSVWEIYEHRKSFLDFARIHCRPLDLSYSCTGILDGSCTLKKAHFLTKKYWYDFLTKPSVKGKNVCSVHDYIQWLTAQLVESKGGNPGEFDKELDALQISKKLTYIMEKAALPETLEGIQTGVMLLAICELSEVNVFEQNFTKESRAAVSSDNDIQTNIVPFPEKDVQLEVRHEPYRFWYYETDTLAERQRIQTFMLKAIPGKNRYEVATIELYHPSTKKMIQSIQLKHNEYVWCNVADRKIIKFLPVESVCCGQRLYRKDRALPNLWIQTPNTDEEPFDMGGIDLTKITCFSTGTAEQGILFLWDGTIQYMYYQKRTDSYIENQLKSIRDKLVEIEVNETGFRALTRFGTIITNGEQSAVRAVRL